MQSSAPPLLIVSGAPASGKTTLARRLAVDLRLPLFARDDLKAALADALGAPADVAASGRLGVGAYTMLYRVAESLIEAGTGVMIESNFRRGVSEAELTRLLAWSDPGLIHCTAAPDVIRTRYADRAQRGERHAVHFDTDRAAALALDLADGRFEPLSLGIPTLVVDTTVGWRPGYEEIRDFAARASSLR